MRCGLQPRFSNSTTLHLGFETAFVFLPSKSYVSHPGLPSCYFKRPGMFQGGAGAGPLALHAIAARIRVLLDR